MSTIEPPLDFTQAQARNAGHTILHAALNESGTNSIDTAPMTVHETCVLLGMDKPEVLKLIKQKLLCAQRDDSTDGWAIERQCALTQQSAFMTAQRDPISFEPQIDDLFAPQQTIHMSAELHTSNEVTQPTGLSAPRGTKGLSTLDRADATAKSVESILDSLDFANVRLEGAMYRIGYLEAQVDSLQEQLKVLPEFRARVANAILTDRENDILREIVAEHEQKLESANKMLEKFQQSKAIRFWSWALGINIT